MSVRVPKYRLHRPSGQALVESHGRRTYLGKYNSDQSKEKYRQYIAQLMGAPLAPSEAVNSAETLRINALVMAYFNHAKQYYVKHGRPTAEVAGIRIALRRLRRLYGSQLAAEFGPKSLKIFRESLCQQNLSRGYINASMSRIRRMFRWAAAEELVPIQTFQALSTVPGLRRGRGAARETGPVRPVADDVVEATLPYLPEVVADMVRVQRLTGMRPAEVCQLRPGDIDRSGDVWLYRPVEHKTEHVGRDRVILIGPQAQQVLWKFLVRDSVTYCFRPCDSERQRRAQRSEARVTPLSCGNRTGSNLAAKPRRVAGVQYATSAYRRAIHRACDRAFPHPALSQTKRRHLSHDQVVDLKEWQAAHCWSPNQLRHAAATDVRRRFGLEEAQILLGHSRADVTQIYAERDLTRAIEVVKQIG